MLERRCLFIRIVLLAAFLLVLVPAERGLCSDSVLLDEEAVFCLYFKLSGEAIDDQDIEDLYHEMGQPIFSAYKPAEFIIKKTLTEKKERLLELMKVMDKKTEFVWHFSHLRGVLKSGADRVDWSSLESELPSATPLIRAAVSKKGKKAITRALHELRGRKKHSIGSDLDLNVLLVPERVAKAYQTRNIARENVLLPIRYVFLHPVRIEIKSPGGTGLESPVCSLSVN